MIYPCYPPLVHPQKIMTSPYEKAVLHNTDLIKNCLLLKNGHQKLAAKLNINPDEVTDIAALDHLFRMTIFNYILSNSGDTSAASDAKMVNQLRIPNKCN